MPPAAPPPPVPRGPLSILLRLVLGLVGLLVPVAGFWLATAVGLASGLDRWPALCAAGAVSLLLPLIWDVWAELRHAAKQPQPERVVARSDRIRLRVLAVNLGFLALMLFALNQMATSAILNRGGWFLGDARSPFADEVRAAFGKVAHAAHATFGDPARPPLPAGVEPPLLATPSAPTEVEERPAPPAAAPARWPLPATPHPAVASLTGTRAASIAAVGAALREAEPDPRARVKALHDFVIAHLRFDADALNAALAPGGGSDDPAPPDPATQTAEAVFAGRRATSLGYANLLAALGEAAGVAIARVDGYTRLFSDDHVAVPHAWNVVELDGREELVDAARDAGTFIGGAFAPGYGTFWLFPPAEAAAWDLLPDDGGRRVPGAPADVAGLLAGTALSTPAAAFGLDAAAAPHRLMASPSVWTMTLPNPRGVALLATAWSPDDGTTAPCAPHTRDASARLRCSLGLSRRWIVMLHAAQSPDDPWVPVGQWRVLQTPSRT